MSLSTKFLLGCLGIYIGIIAIILSASYGGQLGFAITFAIIILMSFIGAAVRYVLDTPKRRAEKARLKAETALQEGRITEGLQHFWRIWDVKRIDRFLRFEFQPPKLGFIEWILGTDAPNFRQLIINTFEGMAGVRKYAESPSNTFIPQELKEEIWFRLTGAADCVWEIAHRLSLLAQSGVKANDASLKQQLKDMERSLKEISAKVNEMLRHLREYVAAPYQYETALRRSLKGLDEAVKQVHHQTVEEKEKTNLLKEMESDEPLGDRLMREAQDQREKEPILRKPKPPSSKG